MSSAATAWWKVFQQMPWRHNVGPRLAGKDSKDMICCNAVLGPYGRVGFSSSNKIENPQNFGFTKNWAVVFFLSIAASLLFHVVHIIGVRSEKKVLWIAARWVVAFVKNVKTTWNFAAFTYPRYSVCVFHGIAKLALAVAALYWGTKPRPTRIWASGFINALCKIERLPQTLACAVPGISYFICSHGKLLSCWVRSAAPCSAVGVSLLYHIPAGGTK